MASNPPAPDSNDEVVTRTRQWVERVVVGLDLCPFARPTLPTTGYVVCAARDADEAVRFFLEELARFQEAPEDDEPTTLVIFPNTFAPFDEYLDALADMQELLERAGLVGIVQLASFHPDYRFEGSEEDDAANLTNRAPYPTVHLLREAMLSRAIDSHPDPEGIPARNEAKLREMGAAAVAQLLTSEPTETGD